MILAGTLALALIAMPLNPDVIRNLNSPRIDLRDQARYILHQHFRATASKRSQAIHDSLHLRPGMTIAETCDRCRAQGINLVVNPSPRVFSTRADFRLCWTLQCDFRDGKLDQFNVILKPAILPDTPPPNYTGLWRIYREDGERESVVYYIKGKLAGPLSDNPGGL